MKILKKISFRIIRKTHNVQLRNILCFLIRLGLPKKELIKERKKINIKETEKEMLSSLKKDGFINLGIALTEKQIESVLKEIQKKNCYNLENGEVVNINSPNKLTQLANYRREDLVQIPEILEIANDSRILNVVSDYFKAKPTISNINCWWSFGDREKAKQAQFFHRDIDDYKFVKMFFYLTDVDERNGPHVFVKGSHKINKLLQLRRFTDEEVKKIFLEKNILTLTRPKGSCFIEDTYGIHKGQLPSKGKRLILQIQYSYLPLHVENYKPIKSKYLNDLKLDSYINRLLINNS